MKTQRSTVGCTTSRRTAVARMTPTSSGHAHRRVVSVGIQREVLEVHGDVSVHRSFAAAACPVGVLLR
jgi:hypothetical protein